MKNTSRPPISRRERPAKPALTRAGIVAAAISILRTEGLDKVTMRRLAHDLDTGPASLYVYIHNVAELHGAMLDELLAAADLHSDTPSSDWQQHIITLLSSYMLVLFAYPSLARSVLALRPLGPQYLRLIDSLLALLHEGGVPTRRAAWGVDLLLQFAVATAAEHGTRAESPETLDEDDALATTLRDVSAAEYPNIAAVGADLISGTGRERLTWGLRALIHGIADVPALED
jgi:AcrR family transcriptional regulator